MTKFVQSDLEDGGEIRDVLHSVTLFLHGFQHVAREEVSPVVHNQCVQQLVQRTLDIRGWTLEQEHITISVSAATF